jgi:hypothetical protein
MMTAIKAESKGCAGREMGDGSVLSHHGGGRVFTGNSRRNPGNRPRRSPWLRREYNSATAFPGPAMKLWPLLALHV